MRIFGLTGYPLEHSFSEKYFAEKFRNESINDARYLNFPLKDISMLPSLISGTPDLCGLNVTIPHKKAVMAFLDYIDNEASEAGSVNVIRIIRSSGRITLEGYNTDIYGFRESLSPFAVTAISQALVLGTGGSSASVGFVLARMGIKVVFVSRRPAAGSVTYSNLNEEVVAQSKLIVNTTPLGMYPDINGKPAIPYQALTSSHILYDLIYNPAETPFLKEGIKRGCRVINGLEMLKLQAEKSWEIWNYHS